MLRSFTLVLAVATATAVLAQPCTPDPLYADSVFGVWPDTTENFMPGTLGAAYYQDLNLIVPAAAGLVDPTFEGLIIDSVSFVGITGLPLGLSIACNSQTPAFCTYLTGQLGCGVVSGVPEETGTFPLVLNVLAHSQIFGNVFSVPYTFGGYRIVINDVNTAVEAPLASGMPDVRVVPNPFTVRTTFEFDLVRSGTVEVRVFDLLGAERWQRTIAGKAGLNRIPFDAQDLASGVYLYQLRSGKTVQTGRVILDR
ncbi:MAG: T9SS type A sorting domain-containing protein [Flavobacteriales bacterium]